MVYPGSRLYTLWYTRVCWSMYHPGYAGLCTTLGIHHGIPPWVHHPPSPAHSTRHDARTGSDGCTALRRRVAERTISDDVVTMVRRVSPLIHPFHCWSVIAGLGGYSPGERGEGGMLRRVDPPSTTRFTVGPPFRHPI